MAVDGLQNKVADRYVLRLREVSAQMAVKSGTPLGMKAPTRKQQAQYWLHRIRRESPEQLIAQGVPPAQAVEMVFPMRLKLIGGGTPKERAEKAEELERIAQQYLAGEMAEEAEEPVIRTEMEEAG